MRLFGITNLIHYDPQGFTAAILYATDHRVLTFGQRGKQLLCKFRHKRRIGGDGYQVCISNGGATAKRKERTHVRHLLKEVEGSSIGKDWRSEKVYIES